MVSKNNDRPEFPPIDEESPTPLYHQIFLIIRDRIFDGTFAFDSAVPGEHELCRIFGISRITAKRALDELAAVKLVVRRRGRDTRVSLRVVSPPAHYSVEGFIKNAQAMGLKTEVELLGFEYTEASAGVAVALNCEPGTMVQHAVRVRSLDGEPFSYLVTWVPEDVGRSYSKLDVETKPLLMLLELSGIVVSRAEQTITAAVADAVAAKALGTEIGAPLLRISRVVYDQADRPVEYIIALYRPDRYQFRMNLTREQGEESKSWSPVT